MNSKDIKIPKRPTSNQIIASIFFQKMTFWNPWINWMNWLKDNYTQNLKPTILKMKWTESI